MRALASSRVKILLFASCPLAIRWLIIAIVVDSFYGQPCRTFSHVGKEVLEMPPSCIQAYSPASVINKSLSFGVCASLNHCRPRNISSGLYCGLPVGASTSPSKTPARFSASISQAGVSDSLLSAAIAQADTGRVNLLPRYKWFGHRNNFQPFKAKPRCDNLFFRHDIGEFNVVFSDGRSATTGAHYDLNLTQCSEI